MGDVYYRPVLNTAAIANPDLVNIRSDYRERPDRTVMTDDHVPNDNSAGINKNGFIYYGRVVRKVAYSHADSR
jgi:hypothetical protein